MECGSLVLLLPEIYGINAHLLEAERFYKNLGFDTLMIDFYHYKAHKTFGYDQQPAAYAAFYKEIGIDRARNQVLDTAASLRKQYRRIFIVGYSVGATVAWRCSDSPLFDGIVCYYGSRIRNFLQLDPQRPVLLLNPSQESGFDVAPVYADLMQKTNVTLRTFPAQHGFADPHSPHYDEQSAANSRSLAARFLMQLNASNS